MEQRPQSLRPCHDSHSGLQANVHVAVAHLPAESVLICRLTRTDLTRPDREDPVLSHEIASSDSVGVIHRKLEAELGYSHRIAPDEPSRLDRALVYLDRDLGCLRGERDLDV